MKDLSLTEIYKIIDKRFDTLAKTPAGTKECKTAISQMDIICTIKKDLFNATYKD